MSQISLRIYTLHPVLPGQWCMGDIITFFIPAVEFSTNQLTYRMTAFGHDGSFSPEASCGDVSGANPTEPLTPVSGEIIILEE